MSDTTSTHNAVSRDAPLRLISFEFEVFGEAGDFLGGNADGRPRIFEVRAGEMLPALERQIVEMEETSAARSSWSPKTPTEQSTQRPFGSFLSRAFPNGRVRWGAR
jgi:hypothetical protein